MGLSSLTALPSRGAFTASELVPVASAPPARTYVAGIARAPLSEHARVKTDGTNILIRQLSQSRARAEAKKRAQRAQAAAEAKKRSEALALEAKRREEKTRAALEASTGRGGGGAKDSANAKDAATTTTTVEAAVNPFSRKRPAKESGKESAEGAARGSKRGKGR